MLLFETAPITTHTGTQSYIVIVSATLQLFSPYCCAPVAQNRLLACQVVAGHIISMSVSVLCYTEAANK